MFHTGGLARRLGAITLALMAIGETAGARASETFPSRPITFIVPFVPGSITDIAARHYAKRLGEETKQPVVVENKPGANGLIGVNATLKAPADGYTVLVGTTSTLATNVALYRSLPYDPIKDFSPLGMMALMPSIVVVPAGTSTSIKDLIKTGHEKTAGLNYSAGATSYQLMSELLKEQAGFAATAIPYKGVGAALNALIGKEVDFSVIDASSALGPVQGGTVKGLAVASKNRLALLPDVPTAAEAGLQNFEASTWVAAVVSAQTPAPVRTQLEQLFTKIADEPGTQEFFKNRGAEVPRGGAAEVLARQKSEIPLWTRIVETAKINRM